MNELARVFIERDKGGIPCQEVYDLAAEKLENLKEQIGTLTILQKRLESVISDWDSRLLSSGPRGRARLLESLSSTDGDGRMPANLKHRVKLSPIGKRKNGER